MLLLKHVNLNFDTYLRKDEGSGKSEGCWGTPSGVIRVKRLL